MKNIEKFELNRNIILNDADVVLLTGNGLKDYVDMTYEKNGIWSAEQMVDGHFDVVEYNEKCLFVEYANYWHGQWYVYVRFYPDTAE